MLASVRTLAEALLALRLGADLIDLKEPSRGALGALDHAAVRVMVKAIERRCPVSATIGDIPSMDPDEMVAAVTRMMAAGVDYIKIGFFGGDRAFDCIHALAPTAVQARLVAVIFADHHYDPGLLDALAAAGFAGAMLDTEQKNGKTLRHWRRDKELRDFVVRARGHGLVTGLAGSLAQEDIAPLLEIAPDYLGFRGALCRSGERVQVLDETAFSRIRAEMNRRGAVACLQSKRESLSTDRTV